MYVAMSEILIFFKKKKNRIKKRDSNNKRKKIFSDVFATLQHDVR